MSNPGEDVLVVDEPLTGVEATATDTLYLLDPAGPEAAKAFKRANSDDAKLNAELNAYFNAGGKSVFVQGYGSGYELPELEDALKMLPAGPGQVVAPQVDDEEELAIIAEGAWASKKCSLLQGPTGATDAELSTLAKAIIERADARGAALFADYLTLSTATGGTDKQPLSLVLAGIIAKNDLITGNVGLAAAGKNGKLTTALSVEDLRTDTRRGTLKEAQVNTAKNVFGSLRNYGFRTLADLETHPEWWDFSGSRVIMALMAMAAVIDEDQVFEQIDGEGKMVGRYESELRAACKTLYDKHALFGKTPSEAYSVDTSANTDETLATGEVTAQVKVKVSPFAEHIVTNITRRPIAAAI